MDGGGGKEAGGKEYQQVATKRHSDLANKIKAPQATMAGSISQSMDTSDGDQMDDGSLELNENAFTATSRPQMTVSSDEVNYLVFRYVLQRFTPLCTIGYYCLSPPIFFFFDKVICRSAVLFILLFRSYMKVCLGGQGCGLLTKSFHLELSLHSCKKVYNTLE